MKLELHLSSKNFLTTLAGFCVFILAVIPLRVPAEQLGWFRWQLAIGAFAAMGIASLIAQALIQSKEDHERDARERARDIREHERDSLLGEIRGKLLGISQKPIEQQIEIVSTLRPKLTLDWRKEWTEMESKFRQLNDPSIFADQSDENNSLSWDIRSDKKTARVEECKALCELAGSKLLASSPAIEISQVVRSLEVNWKRWLQFLKETRGFTDCYLVSSTRSSGKSFTTQAGYIRNLADASAIVSINCVATTYIKPPE